MYDQSSPFASPQPPGPTAKSAMAIQVLRHAILSCELTPGGAFSEIEIETRYRLARAGIRSALQALAAEGLVTPVPRQGWRTRPITGVFISDLIAARRHIEPALAHVKMGPAECERLQTLAALATTLAGRRDPQAIVTARVTDRQFLALLADRVDGFHKKWLHELWDHSQRVLNFLERGEAQYQSPSREDLLIALKASDVTGATEQISREVVRFETYVTRAWLRHPDVLSAPAHQRTARRYRPQGQASQGAPGEQRSPSIHDAQARQLKEN
ncbi:GntR family transcriptional regulator [Microvirga rosea]|uniref:GntR family transcriptional regulator n=1 Tax=Microvirga rosea TaxID=2715425 RepID=UPI001D09C29F|nr:GntR family transcriptional regulator [Microvirga rosea]MCB8822051.1 GntR family transcriptional regulator [Microvirga rosea]